MNTFALKNKYGQAMNTVEFISHIYNSCGIDGILYELNSLNITLNDVYHTYGATIKPSSRGSIVHFPQKDYHIYLDDNGKYKIT